VSLSVNMAQLLMEPMGSTRNLEVNDVLALDGSMADRRVSGQVRLTKADRGIWVQGALAATADEECSRCLVPFSHWVRLALNDMYFPTVHVQTGARRSDANKNKSEEEPDSFLIDAHHTLDITEAARQYLITATPLKPLCKTHCMGLCSRCGTNLNEGICECQPEMDPRWEPLRRLLASNRTEN
jgi:uncharacterized protein